MKFGNKKINYYLIIYSNFRWSLNSFILFFFFRYIKMSSPNMNNLILIGGILAYVSVFLLGTDTSMMSEASFPVMCIVSILQEFHETCHSVTFIWWKKRLQTMLFHYNAGVSSHQRWKQTRFPVCFHLWCELTSTMNVTEWQVS